MHPFSQKIIFWYEHNKRDLPWRNTRDPYLIWLSEIILQQTRVDQGMSYYLKFVGEFPTVKQLAKADNEKVMKLWQGLGYYSRARNLHTTAKIILLEHKGVFPKEFETILALKGVGEYTAAAIASFAYNKPYAVVDGNVYRVLSRVFDISTPIDSTQGKKEFNHLAGELLDKNKPAIYNQAIMEFGAMQCKPINPYCAVCPLNTMCLAYSKKLVAELPVKSKKTKVRDRYFNYIVLNYKGKIAINKRGEKDIWTNLYDFPNIETNKEVSEDDFLLSDEWNEFIKKNVFRVKSISPTYKHILSHQKIYARFWEIDCKTAFNKLLPATAIIIKEKDIQSIAVPRLIENYLKTRT